MSQNVSNNNGQKLREEQENAILSNFMKNKEGQKAYDFLKRKGVEFSEGVTSLDDDKPVLQIEFGKFGYEEVEGYHEIETYVDNRTKGNGKK